MTCTACGDKPKNTAKDFTKAVIEIDNPEALVLLRKVEIPASMGDETQVPPTVGKYRNVILRYEVNKHVYIYSSDGIPTYIELVIPDEIWDRLDALEDDVDTLERDLATEADTRERADNTLQQEIDDLKNSPDVVDIVATYADLEAYDTSGLGNKDVIRVLTDETHDGESTYYRWDKTNSQWVFIGAVEGYYTKGQTDDLLDTKQDLLTPGENIAITDESGALVISAVNTTYTAGNGLNLSDTEFSVDTSTIATQTDLDEGLSAKQDTLTAGENIQIEDESGDLVISSTDTTYTAGYGINLNGTEFSVDPDIVQDTLTAGDNITIEDESGSLVISATDTTYSNFTGTDGTATGVAGLVPAPATTDAGKFLKADGTWGTAGSAINVVQSTGTSTTDVMSQNATTSMIFADPATQYKIKIGAGTSSSEGNNAIEIGHNASAIGASGVACGNSADASAPNGVAIGNNAGATSTNGATAIGANARVAPSAINGIAISGGWQDAYAEGVGAINIGGGGSSRPVTGQGAISLGIFAPANSEQGKIEVGSTNTSYGYNSSNYRLLTGLYDPQSAHDAATKGYVDALADGKQDVLTAGQNITIAEESGALVISATGGSGADVFTTNEWNALWA